MARNAIARVSATMEAMDREQVRAMAASAGLQFRGDVPRVDGSDPVFAYPVPIGEAAATVHALSIDAVGALWQRRTGRTQRGRVDVKRSAASLVSFALERLDLGMPLLPQQWEAGATPGVWRPWGWGAVLKGENAGNPVVGLYRCGDDRWIHLHGGAPHLGARILDVLGCVPADVERDVARWGSWELEEALAAAETSGAVVRTAAEWERHPQGQALVGRPVVEVERIDGAPLAAMGEAARPLAGVRVLDLGDGLAGPTCARTLAQHGAEVLQVTAPNRGFIEPFTLDTGHGKRSSSIDLRDPTGRGRFAELVRHADVVCLSLRSDALSSLGFGVEEMVQLRPGLVVAAINCYGHQGPWVNRRGWEQLGQVVTGLAQLSSLTNRPRLAPAAVCDYLTGYIAAYGTIDALIRRMTEGGSWHVKASLCQSAMWLVRLGASIDEREVVVGSPDFSDLLVETDVAVGRLHHLPPAVELEATPAGWRTPPPVVGGDEPKWNG